MTKQKKVILIGNFAVGKTSLIRRFVENSFSDKYISTIGVKISRKEVILEKEKLMLLIWDIEGAIDKIKRVNKTYMRGTNGAIIVADITTNNIEEDLLLHLKDLYQVNGDIPSVIAFNKIDIDNNFDFDTKKIANSYPKIVGFYKTSAKTGLNVEEMFKKLSNEMSR